MDSSGTIVQSSEQAERARLLSLEPQAEPSALAPDIPGYVLHTLLGRGSFGEVWAATQSGSGQQVAVKIFTQPGGLDWRYLQHEIRRLRQVAEHPHVVTLLHADFNHEPPYFCMGLYQESLSSWRQKNPKPDIDKIVVWFREIALALQFTHEKGLLHCDLKPANVLLDEEGRVRVADFGQAVERGLPGRAVGSLGFMAPEQASLLENSPDVRWDLYGLGSTVYFLLTGIAPRLSDARRETVGSITDPSARLDRYREVLAESHLEPLQSLAPSVDADLAQLIHACLDMDPDNRPQTAGEVLEDLDRRASLKPLLCRRPWSLAYRTERYIKRHRFALLALFMILATLTYATVESYKSSREQRLALATQQFDNGWALASEGRAAEAAYWWGQSFLTDPENRATRAALDSVAVDLEAELIHGPDPLNTVVFHPGGEWLASADSEGTVQLWKDGRSQVRLTGKRKVTSNSHSIPTRQVAFTSDARHLITSGGIYELGGQTPSKVFEGESFFDPDGHGVLLLRDTDAVLFNTRTFEEKPIELKDRDWRYFGDQIRTPIRNSGQPRESCREYPLRRPGSGWTRFDRHRPTGNGTDHGRTQGASPPRALNAGNHKV